MLNGCDLTPLTQTQISEQEYNVQYLANTDGQIQAATNTPNTPRISREEPVASFLEVDETCVDLRPPRFHENFLESEKALVRL